MMERWSAVITSYNSSGTLGRALDSLLSLPEEERPDRIVVVDNASSDDSVRIASQRPGVTVMENRRNLGLARANNRGAAACRNGSLFFLNPDVEVHPGAVTLLRDFAVQRNNAALLGPRMTDGNGVLQSSARTWPSLAAVISRRTPVGNTPPGRRIAARHLFRFHDGTPRQVHWLVGAALWLTPEGRDAVGLMHEGYFLYFEDVEWCRRAWKRGMEVWYVPEARISHVCRRQSSKTLETAAGHHLRSMLRFYASHPSALLGRGPGP